MELRLWVGVWTTVLLFLMVMFDLSALVRYITRFTEESFALLIALIFIKEAIAKLFKITVTHPVKFGTNQDPYYECCCSPPPTTLSNYTTMSPLNTSMSPPNTSMSPDNSSINWHLLNCTYCLQLGGTVKFENCHGVDQHYPDVFFLSVILFLGTFEIAVGLKMLRNSRLFPHPVSIMGKR